MKIFEPSISEIHIFDDIVEKPEIFEPLYNKVVSGKRINFFASYPLNEKQFEKTNKIILSIIKEVWLEKLKLYTDWDKVEKFEVWSNLGSNSSYHLDKDEAADCFIPPKWASALYIGPNRKIKSGELAINTKGYMEFLKNQEPTNFDGAEWLKIPYKFNRMVIFNPFLPHKVLPGDNKRVSLALNIW